MFLNRSGSAILWSSTVTADVTLDGSGAGTINVAGPAIFEANGQYNTVDSALASGDVITLLGATAEVRRLLCSFILMLLGLEQLSYLS